PQVPRPRAASACTREGREAHVACRSSWPTSRPNLARLLPQLSLGAQGLLATREDRDAPEAAASQTPCHGVGGASVTVVQEHIEPVGAEREPADERFRTIVAGCHAAALRGRR